MNGRPWGLVTRGSYALVVASVPSVVGVLCGTLCVCVCRLKYLIVRPAIVYGVGDRNGLSKAHIHTTHTLTPTPSQPLGLWWGQCTVS